MNTMPAPIRRLLALTLMAATTSLAACGISMRQEARIGARTAAQINRQLPIVEAPALNRYINRLGSSIARNADRDFNYHFYIANIEAVNAFALPGGYVYVTRGLVEQTDNLAELSGVLAHEIAHVELGHSAERIEKMRTANIGLSLAYILLGRRPGTLERAAINIGGSAVFAEYSRDAEAEADATAVPLLIEAGIHPRGLITFFKELLREREDRPTTIEQWFSTHPLTKERIAHVRSILAGIPDERLDGLESESERYEEFRDEVAELPPPPPEFRTRGDRG